MTLTSVSSKVEPEYPEGGRGKVSAERSAGSKGGADEETNIERYRTGHLTRQRSNCVRPQLYAL